MAATRASSPLEITPATLKEIRRALSVTQSEYASLLGVEENTVTRWEMGLHSPVGNRKRQVLKDLARARKNARRYGEVA